MSEHQKILLSSCNGGKVGELIGYIERQRDIYRQNVEELLDKLDPGKLSRIYKGSFTYVLTLGTE